MRDPVDEAAYAKSLRPDQLMVCKSAVQRVSVSGVRCQHLLKFLRELVDRGNECSVQKTRNADLFAEDCGVKSK